MDVHVILVKVDFAVLSIDVLNALIKSKFNPKCSRAGYLKAEFHIYRTRFIITRGLYILNLILEGQKRLFNCCFFLKIPAG